MAFVYNINDGIFDPDRNIRPVLRVSREGIHDLEFWRDKERLEGAFTYTTTETETGEIGASGKRIVTNSHIVFPQSYTNRTGFQFEYPTFKLSDEERRRYVAVEHCQITGWSKSDSIEIFKEAVAAIRAKYYHKSHFEAENSYTFSDQIIDWLGGGQNANS